jgi:hypothetical protein
LGREILWYLRRNGVVLQAQCIENTFFLLHLMGVHLTGMHLTGVHLTVAYLMGVYLMSVHLMDVS